MTTRRHFLASLLAAAAVPRLGWADAGAPAFLAAARDPDMSYALYGVDAGGADVFRIPLPARAHAGAAHPSRPIAVAFARRPGTYAVALDCVSGQPLARLETPAGRHFMGHGCFSHDGALLMTAENGYDTGAGRIGLWNWRDGWRRVGELASHGIGPHDIQRLPGSENYVIANGGIMTHPTQGRDKLNLDTMRPNLSYIGPKGELLDQVELAPALHRNSIRHLSVRGDGLVAFAMQYEGDIADAPPLLGLHALGQGAPRLLHAGDAQPGMAGYAGAVAFSRNGARVAISSPMGGHVHLYDSRDGTFLQAIPRADVCGLGLAGDTLVATDGLGGILALEGGESRALAIHTRNWDNHIISLS